MKPNIHPPLYPVIYVDTTTGTEFFSRSSRPSAQRRTVDGTEYHVVALDISSASHPFYTGKQHSLDREGRIERFARRYGKQGTPQEAAAGQTQATQLPDSKTS